MDKAIPHDCPECGSSDTQEKVEGHADVRECCACEAFWYHNGRQVEAVPGAVRRRANAAYAEAEDNRLFGNTGG